METIWLVWITRRDWISVSYWNKYLKVCLEIICSVTITHGAIFLEHVIFLIRIRHFRIKKKRFRALFIGFEITLQYIYIKDNMTMWVWRVTEVIHEQDYTLIITFFFFYTFLHSFRNGEKWLIWRKKEKVYKMLQCLAKWSHHFVPVVQLTRLWWYC